jgi:hypothetical protein
MKTVACLRIFLSEGGCQTQGKDSKMLTNPKRVAKDFSILVSFSVSSFLIFSIDPTC